MGLWPRAVLSELIAIPPPLRPVHAKNYEPAYPNFDGPSDAQRATRRSKAVGHRTHRQPVDVSSVIGDFASQVSSLFSERNFGLLRAE